MPRLRGTRAEVGGFLDVLVPAGVEVVPTVAANAVSSGPVTRAAFDHVKDALLERLAAAGPARRRAARAPRRDGAGGRAGRRGRAPRRGPEGHRPRRSPRRDAGPSRHDHAPGWSRKPTPWSATTRTRTSTSTRPARRRPALLLRTVRGEVRPVTLFARAPMLVPAEGQGTERPAHGRADGRGQASPGPARRPRRLAVPGPALARHPRHRVLGHGRRRRTPARRGDRAHGPPARLAGLGAAAGLRRRPPDRGRRHPPGPRRRGRPVHPLGVGRQHGIGLARRQRPRPRAPPRPGCPRRDAS